MSERSDTMGVIPAKTRTKHLSWNILLWEAFLVMFLYIIYHPLNINHDAALHIHSGQLLLEGKLPYVGVIDTNPPLIMYFNVIPALIARLLSANVILVFSLSVLLLAIWSTLAIRGILLASQAKFNEEGLGIVLLLWFMLSVSLGHHFGQREHLFILLYFPYFVLRWVRWEGGKVRRPMAAVVAIAGGLGTCLKPHFVLIFLATELYWGISKRNNRNLVKPEMIVFVCVGLAYAAHFLIAPDKMREEFFRWLPFIVQRYKAYNSPFSFLIKNRNIQFAFIISLLPFLFSLSQKGGFRSLTRALAVLTLASILVYFIQHTGSGYHAIPALFGAVLILAIIITQVTQYSFLDVKQIGLRSTLEKVTQVAAILLTAFILHKGYTYIILQKESTRYPAVLILCGAILFLTTFFHLKQLLYRWVKNQGLCFMSGLIPQVVVLAVILILLLRWDFSRSYDPLRGNPVANTISRYTKEGDPVLFISTGIMPPVYPTLVQMNRRPGSRWLCTPIALLYYGITRNGDGEFPYHIEGEAPVEETRYLHELAEDIAINQPPLIFVDSSGSCTACPEGFDILQYLTKAGFIQKAMGEYEPLSKVSGYKAFVLDEERRK